VLSVGSAISTSNGSLNINILIGIGLAGVVYGSIVALKQRDLKNY
jgi:formate hydrogenlyase subunit 3/multisubunit Na+/H+ antiporter MnhD subunit